MDLLRYLWRRKLRTALTVLAVAVGIFAVTAVGSITEQLNLTIHAVEANAQRSIPVLMRDVPEPVNMVTVRQLRRIKGVTGFTRTVTGFIEKQEGPIRISVNPELFMAVETDIPALAFKPPTFDLDLWAGRLPAPGSRTETVITWALAQHRHLNLGDTLVIRDYPHTVVGIWENDGVNSQRAAVISYAVAEDILDWPYPETALIPQPGVDLEALAEHIERTMPDVDAKSPADLVEDAREQMMLFSLIVGASGIISLLIGTFTIINTMAVSVQERRQEIGLKKALGAEDAHILTEVVTEALIIALTGGVIGLTGTALVSLVGNRALTAQLGSALFLLTPRLGIGSILFSMIMGVIGGLYPAWRAARLDPVVALRGGAQAEYAGRGLKRLWYLLRRRARVLLTIGGIAIGIFALVLLGSLSEAIGTYVNDVKAGTANLFLLSPEHEGVPLGTSTVREIQRLDGVERVMRSRADDHPIIFTGNIDDEAREVTVWAHDAAAGDWGIAMPIENTLAAGRIFGPESTDEVVLGGGLAAVQEVEVGDTLYIAERPFTVVGIWRKIPFDIGGYDQAAYISLEAAYALSGGRTGAGLSVRALPGQTEAVQQRIEAAVPGLAAESTEELFGAIQQILMVLFAIMGAIFSIAAFVGMVSVVNTMVIAVNEQVPEIGLKKAVGAEDGDILAEVLLQSARLGVVGGGVGVGLAALAILIINPLVEAGAGIAILHLSPRLILASLVFSTLLGICAGLWPASRAAKLDPVVALRSE